MDRKQAPPLKEVPEIIKDEHRQITYSRGKFLGKGGFARCYELINQASGEILAGKIVSKTLLQKSYQRDKTYLAEFWCETFLFEMTQEVQIHRSLDHPNVVKLFNFFEDTDNVYITLELCARRSLMELHKRRKAVTEPEARYFTHHVCLAIDYLHENKIIHRDLKLGNLFLNDDMLLKIGDFGLATRLEDIDERKKTLCGTPNYIAPEVLDKKGHSFEVDIWAVGCILYTLLFGRPPFETKSLKDTYARIKANLYRIPSTSSQPASALITSLLAADPAKRPNVKEVLRHPFFSSGFLPKRLPTSCLSMAPKFSPHEVIQTSSSQRSSTSSGTAGILSPKQVVRQDLMAGARHLNSVPENAMDDEKDRGSQVPENFYLPDLLEQLRHFSDKYHIKIVELRIEDEAPEAMPIYWVAKWVDYSDKYGIGYQLCDNSVGVLFNDYTKLMLDVAGNELTYYEKGNKEHYFTMDRYPQDILQKKVTLLSYFRSYMSEHLLKAGGNVARKEGDDLARLPILRYWFRTSSAIVLLLSNGTVQINFFNDHTKVIVCPLMGAVTFIDDKKQLHVYKLSRLLKNGCSSAVLNRLRYAMSMVEKLLSNYEGPTNGNGRSTANTVELQGIARGREMV